MIKHRKYDAVSVSQMTVIKLLLGNLGKLYGNVGKLMANSNLYEVKPCFNDESDTEGGNRRKSVGNRRHFGKCRNPWQIRMCYAVIRGVFNINVKCTNMNVICLEMHISQTAPSFSCRNSFSRYEYSSRKRCKAPA